jgi:hypothetical protein
MPLDAPPPRACRTSRSSREDSTRCRDARSWCARSVSAQRTPCALRHFRKRPREISSAHRVGAPSGATAIEHGCAPKIFERCEFNVSRAGARRHGTPLAPEEDLPRAVVFVRGDRGRVRDRADDMTRGFKEGVGSAVCFVGVLAALVSVDERVRERFWQVFAGAASGDVSPLTNRLSELGGAVVDAARYQGIENAPMLIFTAVGAVLVMFMLRT